MVKTAQAPAEKLDGRPAYKLGPSLLEWRTEHGISAEAMATAWAVSVPEYRSIETRRMPSPSPAGVRYRDLVALMLAVEARGGEVAFDTTATRLHALHVLHDEDRRVHGTLGPKDFARYWSNRVDDDVAR